MILEQRCKSESCVELSKGLNFDSAEIGAGPRESEFLKRAFSVIWLSIPGRELVLQEEAGIIHLAL